MDFPDPRFNEVVSDIVGFFARFLIIGGAIYSFARFRSPKGRLEKPVLSTAVECTNCGLVNPSAWEKCERCGALLGTGTKEPAAISEDVAPPPLVKKI